jgi:hypothetical protein
MLGKIGNRFEIIVAAVNIPRSSLPERSVKLSGLTIAPQNRPFQHTLQLHLNVPASKSSPTSKQTLPQSQLPGKFAKTWGHFTLNGSRMEAGEIA